MKFFNNKGENYGTTRIQIRNGIGDSLRAGMRQLRPSLLAGKQNSVRPNLFRLRANLLDDSGENEPQFAIGRRGLRLLRRGLRCLRGRVRKAFGRVLQKVRASLSPLRRRMSPRLDGDGLR